MMHYYLDLLFRQKHSEYYKDEEEWMRKLLPGKSTITFNQMRSPYIQSDKEAEDVENAYYLIQNAANDSEVINQLYTLQLKYPHNPVFRNFIRSAYELNNETEKGLETAWQNYTQFPEYLFARTDYAMELIKRKQFDKIPALFNNATTLAELYPEREQFHVTEITAFAFCMGTWYVSKKMIAAGEVHLKCFAILRQKHLPTFNLLRTFVTVAKFGIIENNKPGPIAKMIKKVLGK